MQFRRTKSFLVSLLLGLTGAASLVMLPALLWADAVKRFPPPTEKEYRTRAAKGTALRTAGHDDPDTVWIGHIADSTAHNAYITTGGHVKGVPGGYGPYHIGRGPNRIVGGAAGPNASYNGVWDFDHLRTGTFASTPPEVDSLMGWWPITCPFGSVGPSNLDDKNRPWFCLDYGNQGNYVINQGSPKRTFGVVGYWHMETKAGSMVAWCGLNAHGTNTPTDNVTGNPFNSDVLDYQGNNSGRQTGSLRSNGTDKHFPGYGSQWDQLLYRDFVLAAGSHTLTFDLSTNMDTRRSGTFNAQAGYFEFDPWGNPLSGTSFNGVPVFNTANVDVGTTGEPTDRFTAYVGVPREPVVGTDNDFKASDGNMHDMYDAERPSDPYRRWFSEVVDIDNFALLLTQTGNSSGLRTVTIPASIVSAAPGGKVRVVFRIKTNRGFDDENSGNAGSYTSGGNGAARVTNVQIDGGTASLTASGDIDNTQAAIDKWRSTGKPPGVFAHLHNYESEGIDDPCGSAFEPIRFCNTFGNAMSPGDHDINDKHSGGVTTQLNKNSNMRQKWFVSPTINLKSSGSGDYNGMGINSSIASRLMMLVGDQTFNVYNYPVTGNGFRYVYQAYPSRQADLPGTNDGDLAFTWGELRKTFFFNFITVRGCFENLIGIPAEDQLIRTSNTGPPDSCRIGTESMSRCFTLPIPEAACSPTDGAFKGGHYDNFSIGFATAPPPPALALTIWHLFNDAFPVNWSNQVPVATAGNGFDTTSAFIQSGFNQSADTGGSPNSANAAHGVPGDTAIAEAPGDNVRCDLVFRILPGVGNYVTIGSRSSGLVHRVTVSGASRGAAGNVATPAVGDTSFWGQYMDNAGVYGTGGTGPSPGNGGVSHFTAGGSVSLAATSGWSAHVWNSARMDTLELNEFPRTSFDGNLPLITLGQYATMYHEEDPKFNSLGIRKLRCFLDDKVVGNAVTTNDRRYIRCSEGTPPGYQATNAHHPSHPSYAAEVGGPDYTVGGSSGINGSEFPIRNGAPAGIPGETYEYTEILPHGLFTPGTHIEYFFRKSQIGNATAFDMGPDTNNVFPQASQGSFDYHAWEEFSVLPDRWKDPVFATGGLGMACMLVVDLGDRRGEEATWVSAADSIGLTEPNRRGAHNGWSAAYGTQVEGVGGRTSAIAVRPHLGHPGTIWDFYQVKAGESNVPSGRLGGRYGADGSCPNASDLECPKLAKHGPTQAMLLNFYKTMVWLNADLAEESIGPYIDEAMDDLFLLTQFLKVGGADPARDKPRGLMMAGEDMVNGAFATTAAHQTFFEAEMLTTRINDDYRAASSNANNVADFNTKIYQISTGEGNIPSSTLDKYGVANPCFIKLDVLAPVNPPDAQVAAEYEFGAPYTAAVYADDDGARDARTYVLGSRLGLLGSMRGGNGALFSYGTRIYLNNLLTNIWGTFNCKPSGALVGIGDDPGSRGKAFVNFMNLRSDNPMRSGEARIEFGLAKREKVELRVYDVSGRLVKTLVNRIYEAGPHNVIWDGTNDAGIKVARGVYFYQLRSPSFVSQKKLAVLKN